MGLGLLSPRVHRGSLPFPGLEGAVVPAVRMLMGSLERGGGWGVGGGCTAIVLQPGSRSTGVPEPKLSLSR